MRYPKLRELREAVIAVIKGPYTSKFPKEPIVPAKRFRGRLEYSNEGCIACTACSLVCPTRAIEFRDTVTKDKASRKMIVHFDECHFCGQCSALCTTKDENPPGIKHTTDFDMAGFDRAGMISSTEDKELALCEICGDVITAKAHLEWIAKRLGPLAYSNPTLFVSSLKSLGMSEDVLRVAKDYFSRSDRVKILCSKCRRKATVERY